MKASNLSIIMIALKSIVEDLESLPPAKLEEAATLIHGLRVSGEAEKKAALDDIFGWMSSDEAEAYEKEIESSCERIERKSW